MVTQRVTSQCEALTSIRQSIASPAKSEFLERLVQSWQSSLLGLLSNLPSLVNSLLPRLFPHRSAARPSTSWACSSGDDCLMKKARGERPLLTNSPFSYTFKPTDETKHKRSEAEREHDKHARGVGPRWAQRKRDRCMRRQ